MATDSVAEVRNRTDIVDLVSGYVPLTRTGRTYKGLCPFHQEKTPSFILFPDSQNFHCFGCGRGGDAFTFYMGVEHVEFREALHELARRAGVTLGSVPAAAPEHDEHRQRLIEVNELAAGFFSNVLTNSDAGAPGRSVAGERELSADIIARFGLGFALDRWDALLGYLKNRGINEEIAVEAGLLQTRDSGGYYDRFRGRLMFPIRNRDGRVVGFGGRIVGEGQPKYLNSAQSSIFDKSALVYGLDLAQEEIRRRDQAVIVEGYMDAIAAHQFGHGNVVAAMGTALTESQIGLVKRLSKNIVLALDADSAGQMATLRGLERMQDSLDADAVPIPDAAGVVRFERKLNAQISIVRLPIGKDPDELIRRDPDRWPELVKAAQPFLDFFIDAMTTDVDPGDARGKAEAVKRSAPILQQVGDRVVQAHYVGQLAARLQLDQRVVMSEIRRTGLRTTSDRSGPSQRPRSLERASGEDHLVALLLKYRPLLGGVIADVPAEDMADAANRELLRILTNTDLGMLEPEQIIAGLDDALADHAERLLALLATTPAQFPGQVDREARQALEQLGKQRFLFLMRQLQAGILVAQQSGDTATLDALRSQLALTAERHRSFYPPPSPYFRDTRDNRVHS